MSKDAYTISKAFRGLAEIEKGFISPLLKPAMKETIVGFGQGTKRVANAAATSTARGLSRSIDHYHGANLEGARATKEKVAGFATKIQNNAKPLAYGAAAGGALVGTGAMLNRDD